MDIDAAAAGYAFLRGGGEMGERIRAYDWSTTPLGSPETWSPVLQSALGICLTSSFPTAIYWGEDLRILYNDAWAPIPADKHPSALGRPAREVWSEIWNIIGPQFDQVIASGQGFAAFEQMLPLRRGDAVEETFYNYSFTPLRDEHGAVVGIFNQGNDVTAQVVARRERQAEVERLRELFRQAPGAVALLRGHEHVFEFANDAYLRLIGDRNPVGKTLATVLPEIAEQGFVEVLDGVFRSGQPYIGHVVSVMLRRDPTSHPEERLLDLVFQPVTNAIGHVTGIFIQASDVTERVHAERALRDAHERQRLVFELTKQQRLASQPNEIMSLTSAALGRHLRASRVGFYRVSDDDNALEFDAGWGDGTMPVLTGQIASADLGTGARAMKREDRSVVYEDAGNHVGEAQGFFSKTGTRALIGVPMFRDGRWKAGLYVHSAELRTWRAEEIALVEEVAQLSWDSVERAEASLALRASEERLQLALSASNTIGIWDWDVAQDRVRTDANFARLFGVDATRAAEGVGIAEFLARVHADDLAILQAALERALRTGKRFSLEYRLTQLDGSVRWIVAQGRCTLSEDGSPLRFPGVAFDVTDLKRAQEAQHTLAANLANERTRLKTLVDNLPIGLCFMDAEGKPVLWNPAYSRYVPDQRIPSQDEGAAQRWVGVDDRGRRIPRHRFPSARALRGESVPGVEFIYRGEHGDERWTRVSAVPLLNPAGDVSAVLTVVVDIEEQKRAQQALERLNETLESEVQERTRERDRIWQFSEDMLGIADAHGVWLNVNPAWTRTLGWDAEEILDKTTQWLEPNDGESAAHATLVSLKDGETFSLESRLRAREGEARTLSWRGVRIEDSVYCVARDVTDKRLRDAALLQMQEQLRQSQKMEAVGQLTGGIAHDFNNLLTGILGSLDMLQSRIAQGRYDAVEKYAKAAITSANRAAALTHRLLAFSRRQPLDPRPVAANALIASMEDMLRRTMGEKIQLEISTGSRLWLTRCDANQLENAILNLAINARDAMPNGGRMSIDTSNETLDAERAAQFPGLQPRQYICIAVADTGVGMTNEVQARAYEPFFTTKPLGQGTGLGLSMIYGFAKQSDGYTRIESLPNVGTTVRIYLPRYLGEIAPSEESTSASGRYRAPRARTVLVVEDETIVRNLVVEVLIDLGYRAIEAADGRAGLEVLLSDREIDLVVSDVGLPELDGREMIERARGSRPDLKVLFITGYAQNAMFGGTYSDQTVQLITKPFPMEVLAQRIREMIGDL